jgi:tetratricopeptide (TPR) repeat protein
MLLPASNSGLSDGGMAIDHRDFFISFNSADLAYAEAIDAALRAAGFTTHFHPRDLGAGGNIPIWMDEALMASAQTLALYSPDYMKETAIYSRAERYASWWQDPGDDRRKLIPILLRDTKLTPLTAPISRIEVVGLTPKEAAARAVERLKAPRETEQRGRWRKLQALPKVFRAPYRPNPNFTGRFEDLENLHRALGEHATVAVTAIAGTGGIGKTTLAAEYCHRFGGQYGGVWTIRAEESAVMLADLQELAKTAGVGSGQNTEADAKAALDYLRTRTQPWLIIYDNAPNPDAIRRWLPEGAVRCLITSRFAEFGDLAAVRRLDYWSEQVTAEYLLSRTNRGHFGGATRLARVLGGLPLAAEQAAAYLARRAGVSFEDYAADITSLIKRPKPKGATGEYPDTVYAAFVKSIETLHDVEGGDIALDILSLCAFLSPDGVDLALLTVKWAHEVLPVTFATAMADKPIREDALAALTSLSLLRRQDDDPIAPDLIFHRLLLDTVRDWMGPDARTAWGSAAVQLVSGVFPYEIPNPSTWRSCARLMPHIAPLAAHAPRSGSAGRALSRLLNQAGLYLETRGDRASALILAQNCVALARLRSAEEPLLVAATLSNLGAHYTNLNRLDEAEKVYREALDIEETQLDPYGERFVALLSGLAQVHWKRKEFGKAEQLILRAVELTRFKFGSDSGEYGHMLSNLGALYGDWAEVPNQETRRAEAEAYELQALNLLRRARGQRHPETAFSHHNLAIINARMHDWVRAATEAEQAIAILLSLNLADHPDTQRMALELARFWARSGQTDKAARLQHGDISDLRPVIAEIELEHRAWVAEDPKNRHFGPPSPSAS